MLHSTLLKGATCLDLIITRNDLLARRCQSALTDYIPQDSYTLPLTLSLAEWIKRCWSLEQSSKIALPLSAIEAISMWSEIVSTESSLISLRTGSSAYEAWNSCKIHQINYLDPVFLENTTSKQWQAFAKQFHDQCDKQNQLDFYSLLEILIHSGITPSLFPKKIGFLGFKTPNRLEQKLFTHLKENGCALQFLDEIPLVTNRKINTVIRSDSHYELDTVAHWAFQTLQQDSKQTVVCLIPHLRYQRPQAVAAFQRAARECHFADSRHNYPLSLPLETIALQEIPIVQTALNIINLTLPVSLTRFSPILRSPYVGDAKKERYQRSQLDRYLRQQGSPLIAGDILSQASEKCHCIALAQRIKTWKSSLITTSTQLPSQWVAYWRLQLKLWGWPNVVELSEAEQFYYAQWSLVLDDFTKLDRLLTNIDMQKALDRLAYFVSNTQVPLQLTCSLHTVQLVDTSNYQDCAGDMIWIANAHQVHTASNLSNPFIPYKLQQSLQVPISLSSVLENLSKRASTLIVSSAQPFYLQTPINNVPIQPLAVTELLTSYLSIAERMSSTVKWESLQDEWGAPLVNYEVSGGSDLIKKQAICPFRAFSDYRLGLKGEALTIPEIVPTIAEKAIYLHHVLEKVWGELKTQHQLNTLSETALDQLLQPVLDQAIQKQQRKRPYSWSPTVTRLEKEKVHALIKKWLALERERPSFFVKAVEYSITGTIGPLTLRFTIDRIDQLSNGNLLLIDYKSGSQLPTRQNWMSSRPTDPQLPLYLLSIQEMAEGITWVHMHPEYGGKFIGISAEDMAISGIQASNTRKSGGSWEILQANWHHDLEQLAFQFSKGYAAVDPKDGISSCRYCQYALLCRVNQPSH